jgi:hypothetical protein
MQAESPESISKMEVTFELDLIQLMELWEYLGLPI